MSTEDPPPPPRWLTAQRIMWIVWPAFLMAGVAELVFFSIFDPFDLHFFGASLELSREAVYAMGFVGFWALGIASSTLTLFLESPPGREPPEIAGAAVFLASPAADYVTGHLLYVDGGFSASY